VKISKDGIIYWDKNYLSLQEVLFPMSYNRLITSVLSMALCSWMFHITAMKMWLGRNVVQSGFLRQSYINANLH